MKNKVLTLAQAAALVPSGKSLSIGGFTSQRHPTALLRELIRQKIRDLVIYYHSAGSDVDLLIGAGCVRRLEGAYLADGVFAPVAPNFRRFAESQRVEIVDYSNAAMMARFTAGAMGLPFLPTRSMLGTDMMAESKTIAMNCPFSGESLALVPAVRTDFCLLHVQQATANGLLRIEGQEFLDVQQALAATTVIASCEELVDEAVLRKEPERNRIPAFAVHAVVPVPFGAHPHGVHNRYDYDPEHLRLFSAAAQSDAAFAAYLERFVFGPGSHDAYLQAVGGTERLAQLRPDAGLGYNPGLRRAP
ncbi:MAG: CoA transferase subunit A [Betaproteobacteria bacterium]|nr:CoA transferase subunit A [Betaproteobacteria bacterium]